MSWAPSLLASVVVALCAAGGCGRVLNPAVAPRVAYSDDASARVAYDMPASVLLVSARHADDDPGVLDRRDLRLRAALGRDPRLRVAAVERQPSAEDRHGIADQPGVCARGRALGAALVVHHDVGVTSRQPSWCLWWRREGGDGWHPDAATETCVWSHDRGHRAVALDGAAHLIDVASCGTLASLRLPAEVDSDDLDAASVAEATARLEAAFAERVAAQVSKRLVAGDRLAAASGRRAAIVGGSYRRGQHLAVIRDDHQTHDLVVSAIEGERRELDLIDGAPDLRPGDRVIEHGALFEAVVAPVLAMHTLQLGDRHQLAPAAGVHAELFRHGLGVDVDLDARAALGDGDVWGMFSLSVGGRLEVAAGRLGLRARVGLGAFDIVDLVDDDMPAPRDRAGFGRISAGAELRLPADFVAALDAGYERSGRSLYEARLDGPMVQVSLYRRLPLATR